MVTSWLRKQCQALFSGGRRGRVGRPRSFRPQCEPLERRDLLTVRWVGLGSPDANGVRDWFDSANWREQSSSGTLGGFRRPNFQEDLVFGNDAAITARDMRNGFPTDFEFGNITFDASGYTVAAHSQQSPSNRIVLTSPSTLTAARLVNRNGATTTVNADIRLEADRGTTIDVAGGSLTLGGVISGGGTTSANLEKHGLGTLELTGPSGNTYVSNTVVRGGTVLLNKTTGNAISGRDLNIRNDNGPSVLRLLRSDQIIDDPIQQHRVIVDVNAILNLNNHNETINALQLRSFSTSAAQVELGTGFLTVDTIRMEEGFINVPARINGSLNAGGLVMVPPRVGKLGTFIDIDIRSGVRRTRFDLVISANLVGTGGLELNRGVVSLQGTGLNTYAGSTLVRGVLNLQKSSALGDPGAGTSVVGVLELENPSSPLTVAEPLTLSVSPEDRGAPQLRVLGGGTHTLTGAVTLSGFPDVAIEVSSLTTLVMQGVIDDGASRTQGLIKLGSGTLIFPAGTTHLYNGVTTVGDGILAGGINTLQVDGTLNSPVVLKILGTLTGSGTIQGLTANGGSFVRPGGTGVGTLRVNGNVRFNGSSQFHVDLTPTGGDRLLLQGPNRTVTLSTGSPFSILNVNVNGTIAGGTEFRIIERESAGGPTITGRFGSFPTNPTAFTRNGQSFTLGYTAGPGLNDIVIQRNSPAAARDLALTPVVAYAGSTVRLTGRLTDPDGADQLALEVNWGDGSPVETFRPGTAPFSVTHHYTHVGTYTVHAVWRDQHGEGNDWDRTVTVIPSTRPHRLAVNDSIDAFFCRFGDGDIDVDRHQVLERSSLLST